MKKLWLLWLCALAFGLGYSFGRPPVTPDANPSSCPEILVLDPIHVREVCHDTCAPVPVHSWMTWQAEDQVYAKCVCVNADNLGRWKLPPGETL